MRFITALAALAALSPFQAIAAPDCLCRAEGRFFDQGEVACIRTATGMKLAKCGMAQNVTTWNVVADGCPLALLEPQRWSPVDPRIIPLRRSAPAVTPDVASSVMAALE